MVKNNFKSGAASFYVVAIATLILMIIATSFAAVIIAEIARTSNDDLAQSAYDSAMAGVEDAKLAYYNYRTCKEKGSTATEPDNDNEITCGEIVWYVENSNLDCGMVGRILGRISANADEGANNEVIIKEVQEGDNNMQQAYTCANMQVELKNYITRLSSEKTTEMVKVMLGGGVSASDIKSIKVSWQPAVDEVDYKYTNFDDNKVTFPKTGDTPLASPPTIEVGLIQTASEFSLRDFDMTMIENGKSVTDRGTLYLVPTDDEIEAGKLVDGNHAAGYNVEKDENYIDRMAFLKSNDKTASNLPYTVYCPQDSLGEGSDFICSATIELPDPVGGARSDETFMVVVTVPYGAPDTDVSLEFCTAEGTGCVEMIEKDDNVVEEVDARATLKGMQISLDVTGRANDLYRRVEMRLKTEDDSYSYPKYALQLFRKDAGSGYLINKDFSDDPVVTEYNFTD